MYSVLSVLRVNSICGVVGGSIGSWRTLFTRPQLPHALANAPASVFGLGAAASVRQCQRPGLLQSVDGILGVSGRTNVRNHFPKPNEKKRIQRHGWKARMSTPSGRKILMRRILKGRHVLSH